MKKLSLFALICLAPFAHADTEITPLDMELGHWVFTTDTSSMIEQMLASMPEESRAMIRQMMEEQMKESESVEQCVTAESLENYEDEIKQTFGQGGFAQDCTLDVADSTSNKFVGEMVCPGSQMKISTIMTNPKRSETTIVTQTPGLDAQDIVSIGEWKSSTCPEGL